MARNSQKRWDNSKRHNTRVKGKARGEEERNRIRKAIVTEAFSKLMSQTQEGQRTGKINTGRAAAERQIPWTQTPRRNFSAEMDSPSSTRSPECRRTQPPSAARWVPGRSSDRTPKAPSLPANLHLPLLTWRQAGAPSNQNCSLTTNQERPIREPIRAKCRASFA